MKRFRWGDVVPGCGNECCNTEDEILEQVGVYAAAEHGTIRLTTDTVDAALRELELVN
jgi:predicted small metal-binding protein